MGSVCFSSLALAPKNQEKSEVAAGGGDRSSSGRAGDRWHDGWHMVGWGGLYRYLLRFAYWK